MFRSTGMGHPKAHAKTKAPENIKSDDIAIHYQPLLSFLHAFSPPGDGFTYPKSLLVATSLREIKLFFKDSYGL
jgi:hypothetical protein